MRSDHSYLPRDDILLPPADDTIDDIWDGLDNHAETRRPNPWCILTRKGESKSMPRINKDAMSGTSDTSKSFETVHLVTVPITTKVLLLKMMWNGYSYTTTL